MITPGVEKASNPEDLNAIIKKHEVQFSGSRFNFVNQHKGLRPGCLHGLLARPGDGKSRLSQAIISDTAQTHKTLVILTEEEKEKYEAGICTASKNYPQENLNFLHQYNVPNTNHMDAIFFITEAISSTCADFVFIDNLTTASFYEQQNPAGQSAIISEFSKFARKTEVSIFLVLHTAKNTPKNRLLLGDDIKGSIQAYQQCQYYYLINSFFISSYKYAFLEIEKHRYHDIQDKYFRLVFEDGFYIKDEIVTMKEINEIYSKRDYLGRKESSNKQGQTYQSERNNRYQHYTEKY